MLRSPTILLTAAAALVGAAPAAAFVVAPLETNTHEVAVSSGPAGRALLTWIADGRGVEVSEFAPGHGFGPVTRVLDAPNAGNSAFGALTPDRLVVIATRGATNAPTEAVEIERATGASAFRAPATVANGTYTSVDSVASNAAGDIAAIVRIGARHAVLVAAKRGQAFGPAQQIGHSGDFVDTAALAVGPQGELVVSYYDGVSKAWVQQGTVGSALGAPVALSQAGNRPDFSAAFDGAGNATVTYTRNVSRKEFGVVVARAAHGHAFGAVRTLTHGPNLQNARVSAAGNTTVVSWQDITDDNGMRIVVARGTGAFGRAQSPAAHAFHLHGEAGRYPSQAGYGRVAVDGRGDILVVYPYGPFNAVHVALRRADANGFAAPRLLSGIGTGGYAAPVLTTERTPVIAWADPAGAVRATTARGQRLDFHAPGVKLAPIDDDELGSNGVMTAKLRCSSTCAFFANARITTGRARGQVITRRYFAQRVLRAGRTLTLRFELKAGGKEAFQRTGRAQVKVIVTAANATGAARTARRVLELGRRFNG
jgi:hypothetical protein